ncbi:MAG: TonB C-terminal domain-containing protein [bacterium]
MIPWYELKARFRQRGNVAGVATTAMIHVVLIGTVVISDCGEGRTKPAARERERIIQTEIVEIQAGSQQGTREKGPAYKRRPSPNKALRHRTRGRTVYGPSRHNATHRRTASGPTDSNTGKDEAADAPPEWGSQTGVDAPKGAMASDDRKGAGGTADKGALDPCFTQHAAVVASYQTKVAQKIPRFKRPAFVSADVAANLMTTIRVFIDGAGKIVRVSVSSPSGNPRYDSAALSHVRDIGSFPAPHRCVMYDKVRTRFRATISVAVRVKSSR